MKDFNTSELHWWRCVAVGPSGEIHTFTVSIDPENVYQDFAKIRRNLLGKGLRFVEAKPITADEWQLTAKLLQFKRYRQKHLRGLTGQQYSPISRWSIVLSVGLLFLLALLLVYLH